MLVQIGRDLAGAQGGSGYSSCDATPRAHKGCLSGASADAGESRECSIANAGRSVTLPSIHSGRDAPQACNL